jgi:manganese transport protein
VPLLIFTSDSRLMGDLVNSRWVKLLGWGIVAVVVLLNGWLIIGTIFS